MARSAAIPSNARVDMIVLAPMPMANIIKAIAVNPGDFLSIRHPYRTSCHQVSMISRSQGAVSAESWHALPYDDYLALLGKVKT